MAENLPLILMTEHLLHDLYFVNAAETTMQ